MNDEIHVPVLADRCLELLGPALEGASGTGREPVVVDATVGMAGHAHALLTRYGNARLVGIDRDPEALQTAADRLRGFGSRVTLVHAVYDELPRVLDELDLTAVEGVLFDLGVSSLQLDRVDRGFSYARDAPLDMRMDSTSSLTAEQILADYDETGLRRLFHDYGEERLAGRYARRIVAERQQRPITSSARLVQILDEATPAAIRRTGHPAKRVFQALRIETNRELEALHAALPAACAALAVGGRIVVMSYHSLEDRIVKGLFQARSASSAPVDLPVEPESDRPRFRLLTRGAEKAPEDERHRNPRSASVRLRAMERIRGDS